MLTSSNLELDNRKQNKTTGGGGMLELENGYKTLIAPKKNPVKSNKILVPTD